MTTQQTDLEIITDLKNRLAGPNGGQELQALLQKLDWLQNDEKDFVVDADKLAITEDAGEYEMIAPPMPEGASYRLTIEYTYTSEANHFELEEEVDTVFFVDVTNGELTGGF